MTEKLPAVLALVAEALDVPADGLSAESSADTVPECDSMGQLNVCIAFQERFGVALDMETIAAATSVTALVALVP
jgi:acyl carrier protein